MINFQIRHLVIRVLLSPYGRCPVGAEISNWKLDILMIRKSIQYLLKLFSLAILKKYRPKIVAITGSVGKSSAKEAIFLVLDGAFSGKVGCSERNLNTEIGVPLAIIGGVAGKKNQNILLETI